MKKGFFKRNITYFIGFALILFGIGWIIHGIYQKPGFSEYYHGSYEKAFNKRLSQAKSGNVSAQIDVGNFYKKGLGVKKDYKQAFYWYNKAAEKNSSAAIGALALMYQYGLYVNQNYKKAVELFRKVIEIDNSSTAKYNLALIYLNNEKYKKKRVEGIKYLEEAVEQNNSFAQCTLGTAYYKGTYNLPIDYGKAVNLVKKSAEQGNPTAQNNLAYFYYQGKAMGKNDFEAYKWFYIASKYGKAEKSQKLIDSLNFNLSAKEKNEAIEKANAWIKTHKEMNFDLIVASPGDNN